MSTEKVRQINDSNFESEVLRASKPVLVDFWAPWCGPCKMLAPTIDKIAEENEGKIVTCKVNVDESPETAAKYGIRGIPTVLFFKNGQVVNQIVGNVPKQQLDSMIAKA